MVWSRSLFVQVIRTDKQTGGTSTVPVGLIMLYMCWTTLQDIPWSSRLAARLTTLPHSREQTGSHTRNQIRRGNLHKYVEKSKTNADFSYLLKFSKCSIIFSDFVLKYSHRVPTATCRELHPASGKFVVCRGT